ncbi:MAG: cell shape-determining protein MreB [Chryseolinea sp.]
MKNKTKVVSYVWLLVFALATFTITSCSDDNNDPSFTAPTILITPSTTSALPSGVVSLVVAVTSDAGLSSVTLDGASIKSFTSEKTSAFTYDYTVPATATVGSSITLTFVVSDAQGTPMTTTTTATITVGDPGKSTETITGPITANTTFTASKYYLLKGNVYVQAPAILTIEPGTIIFGDKVTKGALIINRGAKIHAVGTAALPIVFTSSAPKTFRNYGDWGGVVLLGKAQNNQSENQTIEGVTGTAGDDGKYGGSVNDDNSGEMQYVRIEFAGIALSTDNELNGLTFGSVGSGTTIDHIQVSYSGDDSYEWFGGTVNATYLIAYKGWDDDFDTDFGYRGNVQYGVSHRDPNIADKSGSNGFESDNDGAGNAASVKSPLTNPKFSNISWFGPGVYAKLNGTALNKSNYSANFGFGGHLRRNSAIQIYNSILVGSYLEGVHFDKTNPEGAFKGNYVARIGVNVAGAVKKVTTGNADGDINLANFDTDNFNTATLNQASTDQSTVIAGLTATNLNVDTPLSLLAGGSTLLTGGVTVPAGLTQTAYIGAFDATTNWSVGTWINYNPNATSY